MSSHQFSLGVKEIMWLSGHYTELRLRGPHEIEMATCDWEGHIWLRGHHVIERAPYDWEGTMWFSGYHITDGIIWVLLLDYIGHHGLPGTCVHVGLTVGVDVNSRTDPIISMPPKPPASAILLSDTEWLVTQPDDHCSP